MKGRISGQAVAWLTIVVVAASVWTFRAAMVGGFMRLAVRRAVDRYDTTPLYDGKLHVVFCGTGTQAADAGRAKSCIAVMAGGTLAIFDTGTGSAQRAQLLGLPLGELNTIFLTNLHSDHIGDLGQYAETSWREGRVTPLAVYGPAGTSQVVAGFDQAYALSVKFRAAHANEVNLPADNTLPVGHDVTVAHAGDLVPVFNANGLRIAAFLEAHPPVSPAFGYRIDYRGRTVVISGATRANANLVRVAHRADVLIVDALYTAGIQRMAAAYTQDFGPDAKPGSRDVARHLHAIEDFDTSVEDAGKEATEAQAGTLVLTQVEPAPGAGLAEWLMRPWILHPARAAFHGPVILADDGTRLALAPAQ